MDMIKHDRGELERYYIKEIISLFARSKYKKNEAEIVSRLQCIIKSKSEYYHLNLTSIHLYLRLLEIAGLPKDFDQSKKWEYGFSDSPFDETRYMSSNLYIVNELRQKVTLYKGYKLVCWHTLPDSGKCWMVGDLGLNTHNLSVNTNYLSDEDKAYIEKYSRLVIDG